MLKAGELSQPKRNNSLISELSYQNHSYRSGFFMPNKKQSIQKIYLILVNKLLNCIYCNYLLYF